MVTLGTGAAGAAIGWLVCLITQGRISWRTAIYAIVQIGSFGALAGWTAGVLALLAFTAGVTAGVLAHMLTRARFPVTPHNRMMAMGR
jgi:hypothetical protein